MKNLYSTNLSACVSLILILLSTNVQMLTSQLVNECPNEEDYSPCICSSSSGDIVITCDEIPLNQVQIMFNQTSPADIYQLKLTVNSLDISGIPYSFLVNKRYSKCDDMELPIFKNNFTQLSGYRFERINIYCPTSNDQFLLKVDQDAFRSSQNYTKWFQIHYCEMQRFDFTFMTGFDQLTSFSLRTSSNIHLGSWASFPLLPKLDLFEV